MDKQKILDLGNQLYDAFVSGNTIPPLIEQAPEITLEDAYQVQQQFIERRLAAGEHIVGKKIGVTSKAVQDMLGVFQPDFGQLTSDMVYQNGARIGLDKLIQPKAEAELAFVLKEDLIGPGITMIDVIRATDYVAPCFEIVDSRIHNWQIKIQDTVADNASCGVFALGEQRADPRDIDMTLAGMVLKKNDEIICTGVGAAVQGSPANAVAWLANTLGELGLPFRAGEIILSGSQSRLVDVGDGDVIECNLAGLGSCTVSFHDEVAS